MTLRIIPAIMSGGAGTRLWPLSTEDHPKQFHALIGPRTMFAETVARVSGRVGDIEFAPPIVLCGEKHLPRVRSALAEANANAAAIVIEPAARNTAAVAASAAAAAREIDSSALALLLPSDHVVSSVAAFHEAVARATPFARERIVTFGITPQNAATGYGYIKRGDAIGDGVFAIETFKEKPDEQTAQAYLRDGGYAWNSGMFLFAPETLLGAFGTNVAIRDHALAALKGAHRNADVIALGAEYENAPALPLDIAVMEQTTLGAVVPCDIGWADVGSWAEVLRLAPRNIAGFTVLGSAASADTSKMRESGIRAFSREGDDLIILATSEGINILPRGNGASGVVAANLLDPHEWSYEKIPRADMPQFFEHDVVNKDGWRLRLGFVRPDGEEFTPYPFHLSLPDSERSLRFTLGVRHFDVTDGQDIAPDVQFHLEELLLRSNDRGFLPRIARGARALILAVTKGRWKIERLHIVPGSGYGAEDP